jgi:hypothetical protein
VDHELVRLKLSALAEAMHSQIAADERRISAENRLNQNTNAFPSLLLDMKVERTDEWMRKTYEIYCEVWLRQGFEKTAEFIRAVIGKGLMPVLAARTGAIKHEFELFVVRTGFNSELAKAHTKSLQLRMESLGNKWKRQLEIEARETHYSESTTPHRESSDTFKREEPQQPLIEPKASPTPEADRDKLLKAISKKVSAPDTYQHLAVWEAALYFGVSHETIYRWTSENLLKRGAKRGTITIASIIALKIKRARRKR